MGALVLPLVMLSSGLALAARSIQMSPGGPTPAFYGALIVCGISVFMLVRAVTSRRSARRQRLSTLTMREAVDRWRMRDTEGLFDPPARSWGAAYGSEMGLAAGRTEFRDAARALLFACDEDPQKAARSRRALRSACRRTHFRGVVPVPQPQRRRVRARPRLLA